MLRIGREVTFVNGVDRLMSDPTILRLARFIILATHDCIDSDENNNQIYKGWTMDIRRLSPNELRRQKGGRTRT